MEFHVLRVTNADCGMISSNNLILYSFCRRSYDSVYTALRTIMAEVIVVLLPISYNTVQPTARELDANYKLWYVGCLIINPFVHFLLVKEEVFTIFCTETNQILMTEVKVSSCLSLPKQPWSHSFKQSLGYPDSNILCFFLAFVNAIVNLSFLLHLYLNLHL